MMILFQRTLWATGKVPAAPSIETCLAHCVLRVAILVGALELYQPTAWLRSILPGRNPQWFSRRGVEIALERASGSRRLLRAAALAFGPIVPTLP